MTTTDTSIPALDANRIMFFGTVRSLPFAEQLRAAALTGCGALSIGPFEYLVALSKGLSPRDMLKMAADTGVRLTHLDPFTRWVEPWLPEAPGRDFPIAVLDFDADAFFRIADVLELRSFSAVGCFPTDSIPFNRLVDCFGALCERAARHDIRVDLEFVSMWGLGTLDLAWRIVQAVDAPNSGIMLDLYHYTRGGGDDALLASIPGSRITGVQLDDGDAVLPPGVTIFDDTMNRRRAPHEGGGFRVRDVVAILKKTGGLNNYGPEIYSAAFDPLTAPEIAARCRAGLAWALGN